MTADNLTTTTTNKENSNMSNTTVISIKTAYKTSSDPRSAKFEADNFAKATRTAVENAEITGATHYVVTDERTDSIGGFAYTRHFVLHWQDQADYPNPVVFIASPENV